MRVRGKLKGCSLEAAQRPSVDSASTHVITHALFMLCDVSVSTPPTGASFSVHTFVAVGRGLSAFPVHQCRSLHVEHQSLDEFNT